MVDENPAERYMNNDQNFKPTVSLPAVLFMTCIPAWPCSASFFDIIIFNRHAARNFVYCYCGCSPM